MRHFRLESILLYLHRISVFTQNLGQTLLTVVFAYLAVLDRISNQDFLTIFSVVIAFYFGTQSQRLNEKIEKDTDKKQL